MFGVGEMIWFVILYIILPIGAYWIVERVFGLAKRGRSKRIAAYLATVVAAIGGWLLQQLFLPLGFVALLVVPFVALFLSKVPFAKSAGAAVTWAVGYFFLLIVATIILVAMNGFS